MTRLRRRDGLIQPRYANLRYPDFAHARQVLTSPDLSTKDRSIHLQKGYNIESSSGVVLRRSTCTYSRVVLRLVLLEFQEGRTADYQPYCTIHITVIVADFYSRTLCGLSGLTSNSTMTSPSSLSPRSSPLDVYSASREDAALSALGEASRWNTIRARAVLG